MSLLSLIFGEKKATASVAKERLQLIIARERVGSGPDFLPDLQKDLVAVISKYIPINQEDIKVALEKLLGAPCYHMAEVFAHPDHVGAWHLKGEPDSPKEHEDVPTREAGRQGVCLRAHRSRLFVHGHRGDGRGTHEAGGRSRGARPRDRRGDP